MTDRAGGMDERDVDERFASIVSHWDSPLPPAEDPRPDAAGPAADDTAESDPGPKGTEEPTRPPWVNPSPMDAVSPPTVWRAPEPTPSADGTTSPGTGAEAGAPDDEHYEPPAVRLPPQEDLHFWGAVIGLVAGPLMLLYVAMARPFHSTRWFLASVAVSLLGFGLLVLRQPSHRDPTSGDDGARL